MESLRAGALWKKKPDRREENRAAQRTTGLARAAEMRRRASCPASILPRRTQSDNEADGLPENRARANNNPVTGKGAQDNRDQSKTV